jgi:hypothetical protein
LSDPPDRNTTMVTLSSFLQIAGLASLWISSLHGFAVQPNHHLRTPTTTCRHAEGTTSSSSPRMGELTPPEQRVYDLLIEIHESPYSFRVVVVGAGAILETTAKLGPVLKVTQQPSTGSNLMTLASEDQSFEFHVRLSQVSKMVLTSRETPQKTLRLLRLLNASGDSMCTVILADDSEAAAEWFEGMLSKYGSDIQL